MYCPNCSTQAAANQKYCRTCGVNLEEFSELLSAMLPDQTAAAEVAQLRERLRRMERWAIRVLALGGLVAYLLFLVNIIWQVMVDKIKFGQGILLLSILTGALFISLSIIRYAWLQ